MEDLAKCAPRTDPGDEVLRYFTLRKLWEAMQYGKLNNDDIEFLNLATKRFDDAPTDIRYRQWTFGRISSDAVRAEFRDLRPDAEELRKLPTELQNPA